MDLYTETSFALSADLTKAYSTSFSAASELFDSSIRGHIYNIYGLVRVADEIVDTYEGNDQRALLDDFEAQTYAVLERGFDTNPIIHAFVVTARKYEIQKDLIAPFFESMRSDIEPQTFTQKALDTYIYGSAEVVGLMCLKVFCNGDERTYNKLAPGAQRLGVAYQKVNFLRDMAEDHNQLGRYYFVESTFESLDEAGKTKIIADIKGDFDAAKPYINALPASARQAVSLSYRYYAALVTKLDKTPVAVIKQQRIRLGRMQKLWIYVALRLRLPV